jgi:hypothetical protein
MSTDLTYPYSLEIAPCEKPGGHFRWTIRERGKLLQRSDRVFASEQIAREKGEAELARLFMGRDRGR